MICYAGYNTAGGDTTQMDAILPEIDQELATFPQVNHLDLYRAESTPPIYRDTAVYMGKQVFQAAC